MALSGAFTGTTGNQYIFPTIKWSAVQSIDGNYSDVTATLYYSRSNSGYTTTGTWSGGITINGSRTSGSKYLEISYQSGTLAISATTRVYHNADGSKDITISADGSIGGTSLSSTSISATVTLDTIPRATTAVVDSLTMGKAGTITLNPASSGFTHTLTYAFGSVTGAIATKTSAKSVSWTPPKSLAEQIPRATVGIGSVYCTTYNGDTEIGTVGTGIQITISDDAVPTISAVAISEAVSGLAAKFGAYVQSKSKAKVNVIASGIYGSSIASCEVRVAGILYNGTSITSNMITASGEVAVQVKVTDTRGRAASTSKTITVLPYSPPKISELSAKRIDTTGADNDDGTRVALTMAYAIASLNGKNDRKITLSYRKETETEFTQISTGTAEVSYDDTLKLTDAPEISADDAYVIRVVLQDYFTSVTSDVRVESTFALLDFYKDGTGAAAGKAATQSNLFEFGMPASFPNITVNRKTLLDWTHPVGSIYQSTKSTDPADLFGGTWEAINNVFLLAAGTIFRPGATGGEVEHTLTQEELPAAVWTSGAGTGGVETSTSGAAGVGYGMRTQATNWGQPHNNMPPYVAVYMWKRTA